MPIIRTSKASRGAYAAFTGTSHTQLDNARLTPSQESPRQEVLIRLASRPNVNRAFVTRFEGKTLIVALAVRGVGTCELAIPEGRLEGGSLADYNALMTCLEKPGILS